MVSSIVLLSPTAGQTQTTSGGLSSAGSPRAVTAEANVLFLGMNLTYLKAAAYYEKNQRCAPADTFLAKPGQGNIITSITNDDQCAIIGKLGPNAAGPLQNQYVRLLPLKKGSNINFSFPLCITSIDTSGSNTQSMLKKSLPLYFPSPTLQPSSFGNCATAPSNRVLSITYQQLASQTQAANNNSNVGQAVSIS